MRSNIPSNMDDVIDSRDVIGRIKELETERDDLDDTLTSAIGEEHDTHAEIGTDEREDLITAITNAREALTDWDADNGEELKALQSLADDASGSPDWKYGETLIRDSYFEEYAQQLADDIGAINANASWPNDCIDWERAARQLQMDYTSVDFDGIDYWIRS